MKNSKILKGMIIFVTLMAFVIIFNKPTNVYAAESGSEHIEAETYVILDDNHEIYIHANTYVEYSFDEGICGWITYAEVDSNGGVSSNNVNIDTLRCVDVSDFGRSTYYEKYYFYGFDFYLDYAGYITIYTYCDEWGDISSWAVYEEI